MSNRAVIYSPVFVDDVNGVAYTYNDAEGVNSLEQSREVLRARSIIAAAFMRGRIKYREIGGLLFYGERESVNSINSNMWALLEEFPRITASGTTTHVGYYVLPQNNQAGWASYPGWAVNFMTEGKSAEHTMFDVYRTVRKSIIYLIKRPEIYGNVVAARYTEKQEIPNIA